MLCEPDICRAVFQAHTRGTRRIFAFAGYPAVIRRPNALELNPGNPNSMFRIPVRQRREDFPIAPLPYLAALLAFAVTAFSPQVWNDGDTYMHLAAGSWMLQHHALLSRDVFSFTYSDAYWQTHEWLSEILMAAVFRAGGWTGLLVLCAGAGALGAYIIAAILERIAGTRYAAAATIVSLSCVSPSLLLRPHLLAFPLFALWSAQLVLARAERRPPPLAVLPIMAIWANLHASFPVGLALAAALGLESILGAGSNRPTVASRWLLFGIAATLSCLLTPYGLKGLLFPLRLMSVPALQGVREWQSVGLEPQPIYIAALAILYLAGLKQVRMSFVRSATILALVALAFAHIRHQMIFGVIAPMLFAEPVAARFGSPAVYRMRAAAIGMIVGLLGLVALRFLAPLHRTDNGVSPAEAIAHVPARLRAQPVFNDYAFGGYLIFVGIKPFIDSRAELYGQQFMERYLSIIGPNREAMNAAVAQYGIRWAILAPRNPAVALFETDSRWQRIYADKFAVAFALRSEARP